MKIYTYKNCDTCRKALKYLDQKKIAFTNLPIRETPPSKAELQKMLGFYGGDLRRLFNTSGQDYQKLQLKDKLSKMSTDEALTLLAGNGNLVKRPFLLTESKGLVGFREEEWKSIR